MVENSSTKLALIKKDIENIFEDICKFITRTEFNSRINPVEKIVYGFVGLVLVSFAGALIALIIKK